MREGKFAGKAPVVQGFPGGGGDGFFDWNPNFTDIFSDPCLPGESGRRCTDSGSLGANLDWKEIENYPWSMDYRERITIDPRIRSGKPCIRGTRITVADVFDYLGGGMTISEVLDDFPDLTADDIRACFAFAADRDRRLNVVPHEVAL